nr:cytochrome P450 716B1-like [Tanacetum cinerariifolium]
VIVSASMTHMDDNIFQNPTTFDPARFKKRAPPPPPYSLVAFGAGPRILLCKQLTLSI